MAIGLTALGLLTVLVGCSGTFVEPQNSERTAKCSLTGRWENDKGAKIVITHNIKGLFSGFYLTALGATNNTIPPLLLQGIQHLEPQPTFGFGVKWKFSASTTVFVGQCVADENGGEQLKTALVLRAEVGSAAEDWKATRRQVLGKGKRVFGKGTKPERKPFGGHGLKASLQSSSAGVPHPESKRVPG